MSFDPALWMSSLGSESRSNPVQQYPERDWAASYCQRFSQVAMERRLAVSQQEAAYWNARAEVAELDRLKLGRANLEAANQSSEFERIMLYYKMVAEDSQARIQALEKRVEKLENSKADLEISFASAGGVAATLGEQNRELNEQLVNISKQVEQFQADLRAKDARIAELEEMGCFHRAWLHRSQIQVEELQHENILLRNGDPIDDDDEEKSAVSTIPFTNSCGYTVPLGQSNKTTSDCDDDLATPGDIRGKSQQPNDSGYNDEDANTPSERQGQSTKAEQIAEKKKLFRRGLGVYAGRLRFGGGLESIHKWIFEAGSYLGKYERFEHDIDSDGKDSNEDSGFGSDERQRLNSSQ